MQLALSKDTLVHWSTSGPEVSISADSHKKAVPAPGPGIPPKWVHFASHASTAYTVLAIGIALSAAAAYWTAGRVQRELGLRFESAVTDAQAAIESLDVHLHLHWHFHGAS